MQFAIESLSQVRDEIGPLLEKHYEELTLNRDVVKLDPMWGEYQLLDMMDRLAVYTIRDEARLVGYAAFILNRNLHYAKLTVASNDVLFLLPEYRKGRMALRFFDFIESDLIERGADKIIYHVKCFKDWRPILHRKGYADEEVMVGKIIRRN